MSILFWVPVRVLLLYLGLAATVMPRSLELRLGPWLGRLVLALGLFKGGVALENIRRCFPELGPAAQRDLLRRNFEHYGILFFEFMHFFSPLPSHFREYTARISVLEGMEHWRKAAAKGKGVLFFSSHVGFWEMSAAAAGLTGLPVTVVTTVLKPAWLHDKIKACRNSTGVRQAHHPGAMPAVLRALRKGESVAFMNDQYAPPPMGRPVKFFGVSVNTLAAICPLAQRTGAAILGTSPYRDKDGIVHVCIEPEMELGDAAADPERGTQILAAKVEEWVRRHPEQWLWIHRRFKNVVWPEKPVVA